MCARNSTAQHHKFEELPLAEYLASDTISANWIGDELYAQQGYAEIGYFFDPDAVSWIGVENG